MQYTDKVGTITRVGPKKTEFPIVERKLTS